MADERLELLGGDGFDAQAARVVDDCLGQRVLGPGLDGGGELEGLLLVVAVERDDVGDLGLALRQRPGLVHPPKRF